MTFCSAFPTALRTSASSFLFPVKSLFCNGYDWLQWVAKSCTTTAYLWLFQDSQPSLKTLWSAAKSPYDLGSPADLAIPVFREVSPSFLTDSTGDSRKELAGAPRCSGTLPHKRFTLNSCNHSGNSGNRFLRASSLSSFSSVLVFLVGSGDRSPCTRSLTRIVEFS